MPICKLYSPIRNAEGGCRGLVTLSIGSLELIDDVVDTVEEGLLKQCNVGSVPGWEQRRHVGAVTNRAIGRVALHTIPSHVGNTVDTSDLIVGKKCALILPPVIIQSEKIEVPLVGICLELSDFQTWLC